MSGPGRACRARRQIQQHSTINRLTMKLSIHQFVPFSHANGPGCRAVVWVQGCRLRCPGCFNPDTHPLGGGQLIAVARLADRVIALGDKIEGVTISGGEPLDQVPALTDLLRRVKTETELSTIVFTGYTWKEAQTLLARSSHRHPRKPAQQAHPEVGGTGSAQAPSIKLDSLLRYVDVLIAGRYNRRLRLARGLRGSANKTIHLLSPRYSLRDIESVPVAEVIIDSRGTIAVSGVDPMRLQPL
jgi:anaerobic ribonucleoside-triphosphate reductase activating protein